MLSYIKLCSFKDTEICQICIVNHSEIGGERIIQSYRIHSFIMDRTVFFIYI